MSKNSRFFGFFLKNRYFAQNGQNLEKAVFFTIFFHFFVFWGDFWVVFRPTDPL